jgi:hemerythrin superfamily protein
LIQSESLLALKRIIQEEITDLRVTIEERKWQGLSEEQQVFSRVADRNDMIRINTLRWVLDIIEKLGD